jgi:5-methylcytosine-specific restriction enzyme subunit McrC
VTTISAFEYGTLHVGARVAGERSDGTVTSAEFDALARFNDAHGQRYFRLGHRRLTFGSFVGYLQVGKLGIEVLPKLGRETQRADHHARWQTLLLEMLRVAAGLPLHSPTDTQRHVGRPTLLELVALRFTAELERLLHEGLSNGYRSVEANGCTFRGRLLGATHIRANAARPDRFYVRYAIFDRDILINRILAAALDMLDRCALAPALMARLTACALAFPDTSVAQIRAEDCERVSLGRSTARYGDALVLARLILEQKAPELRGGTNQVFALLFDMNTLWERYVGWLFRRALPPHCEVVEQESWSFWQARPGPARRVRPDAILRERGTGRNLLAIDAKWKVITDAAPADDDLKQMFVYNHLLGAPQSILVYPSVDAGWHQLDGRYVNCAHRCGSMGIGLFEGPGLDTGSMVSQVRRVLADLDSVPPRLRERRPLRVDPMTSKGF